jgi:hypothetical protein
LWILTTSMLSWQKRGLMSSIDKQIVNMENHLFTLELAIEAAMNRKEEEELNRKRNKFNKKLKKLKRKACSDSSSSEATDENWR